MLALFNCVEVQAANYSSYEGNISSTYLDMLSRYNVPVTDDYVVFRGSQYDYYLIYGDLVLTDNVFSGSGTVVCISQVHDNSYSNYYSIETFEDNNIYLYCSDRLVYSSLGLYPSMYDSHYYILFTICFVLVILLIISLVRPLFNFVNRNRKGVIS